jgi:anti-sigma B factor antagonist
MKTFEASVKRQGPVAILRLAGEFDLAGVDRFHAALEQLPSPALELVVIDLRALDYLDSSGLRCIVQAQAHALQDGYELQVVKGTKQVDEVFRITGLDRQLPMVNEPPADTNGA